MICIIFDIDDTLYEREAPFRYACSQVFGGRWKLDSSQLYKDFFRHGNEMFEASMNQRITMDEMYIYRIKHAMADSGASITDEEALEFQSAYLWAQKHIKLSPGMKEVLDFCRESKLFMGILTNGKHQHQYMKYQALELYRWIPPSAFLATEDIGLSKPDPRAFQRAAKQLQIAPEHIWYIGDSYEHDVLGAHAAGCHSIWLDHYRQSSPISGNAADATVHTAGELLHYIQILTA